MTRIRPLPAAVAIDARMIRHSGIGVVLRSLLCHWAKEAPPWKPVLLGEERALRESLPPGLDADIIRWNPTLYSPAAALLPPRLSAQVGAWYSPHYATCLAGSLPLVSHVHDVLHITHPTRRGTAVYMRAYIAALRRRASFVLTDSRHVKVQLQTLFGFKADRVLDIGIGPGVMDQAVPRTGMLPGVMRDVPYVLAVGICKPHKNWPFLFERLGKMPDITEKIVCAGLGSSCEEIRRLAREHGLLDRLVLPGDLSTQEMVDVFASARALLYPSLAEGFGLPVLEAMMAGVPVVVADRSPMKETAGRAGFYFDPDWPESFDAAVRLALGNQARREERIRRGLDRSREFTWAKTAHHLEDAIHRAATGELPPVRERTAMVV